LPRTIGEINFIFYDGLKNRRFGNRSLCVLVFLLALIVRLPANAADIGLLLDSDYFPEVKQRIDASRRSIRMVMFEAVYYHRHKNSPSNRLISALIDAKKRGVTVEVILDVRNSGDRNTVHNLETADILKQAGVDVFIDSARITTHNKLLIIDEKTVIIGSTNWTYSALAVNHEASVVFDSEETAGEFMAYFEKIKKSAKKL